MKVKCFYCNRAIEDGATVVLLKNSRKPTLCHPKCLPGKRSAGKIESTGDYVERDGVRIPIPHTKR